jgi:hypothetical protein
LFNRGVLRRSACGGISMGSFANSLHVKSDRSDRVATAIADTLAEQGWQPTTKPLPEDASLGMPSPIRGLQVSVPAGGWVSVLDSDLGGVQALTTALAARLKTHAIFFLVNDSDAWSYLLADPRGGVSEFDTAPEDDDTFDDLNPGDELELAQKINNLRAIAEDGTLHSRMEALSQQLLAEAPAEIRELEAKLRGGNATVAEIQQFQAWSIQEMPKRVSQISGLFGDLSGMSKPARKSKAKRKKTKAQKAADARRLDDLRPLLAPGVTDDEVQAALDKRSLFAETLLAEFLPLLGITNHFAFLSYRYLDESTPEDLSAQNIRFLHDLRFESGPTLRLYPGP